MTTEIVINSPSGQDMMALLPTLYEEVYEMKAIMAAAGPEFDVLKLMATDVIRQWFVETATWGLSRWEAEFGITPLAGQPLDQRRAVIRSRIRGTGTVTIRMIKRLAEAYDGGAVEVTNDSAAYTFTVHFVDTRGVPPNLEDLKAAIELIKPAHLAVEYEFSYLTWDELDAKNVTWNQFNAADLTWDELEVWR